MPFNPATYRLTVKTHLGDALDKAIENGSAFIPCETEAHARYLRLSLGQYRSAYETQAQTWDTADPSDVYKYSWLRFSITELGGTVGVLIEDNPTEQLKVYDPETMEEL